MNILHLILCLDYRACQMSNKIVNKSKIGLTMPGDFGDETCTLHTAVLQQNI